MHTQSGSECLALAQVNVPAKHSCIHHIHTACYKYKFVYSNKSLEHVKTTITTTAIQNISETEEDIAKRGASLGNDNIQLNKLTSFRVSIKMQETTVLSVVFCGCETQSLF
jgi:hypothetical protein